MAGRVESAPPPREAAPPEPPPPPAQPPPGPVTTALTQDEAIRVFGVGGITSTGA